MVKFTTNDRMAASFDGKLEQVPWSAECSQYTTVDGIRIPSRIHPQGDLVCFYGRDVEVMFF
jgi:hypothetical protein